MNISIIKCDLKYLDACAEILRGSELGMRYFISKSKEYVGKETLEEGFNKKEIYVALDENNNCVGFLWILIDGIFHCYPYLHVVAVKKELRGKGLGKQLMNFFEEMAFVEDNSSKAFLVVGSFNTDAKKLYERLGYVQVGEVPDLYVNGLTEFIMMKLRPRVG